MTPILLLEVNEIPWRVLDRYGQRPAFPHLRAFIEESDHYTTMAVDTGELSPWVTWPTLHRGMNNEGHGIRNLGQDPATYRGVPVWQEIRRRGGTIGVCGSMQSWPPLDPGPGGFYLPDTFAHDARCYPEHLEPLQAFNLAQVSRNGRIVQGGIPAAGEALRVGAALVASGIRLRTMARTASQLAGEKIQPALTARRPVFQTILFWDVFRKLFAAKHPPAFSTFFTNHVAGVMHRYWADVFPEDFGQPGTPQEREPVMQFAIRMLDDMLRDVRTWCRANPDLVVILASSMGQNAVHRPEHQGVELVVEDVTALLAAAGCARNAFQPLLAMVPQVAVEITDAALRAATSKALQSAICGDGTQFIKVQETGATLSITVTTPRLDAMRDGGFTLAGRRLSWQEGGIRQQEIEPGTGYHIPQGTLLVHQPGAGGARVRGRPAIQADLVKNWLLRISEGGRAELNRPPTLQQDKPETYSAQTASAAA